MKRPQLNHWLKYMALLALTALLLTGCFGGTVAQQLARTLLMHGADKATAVAIEAQERKEKLAARYLVPKSTELDDYQIAFLRSGFETTQPKIEALPQADTPPQTAAPTGSASQALQVSKLVNVEVWSLLVGDEKQKLLEEARLQGSQLIPPREEWSKWYLAVGVPENIQAPNSSITFLIPPEIGKMRSGGKALVEISTAGDINIARYALN